MRGNYNLILGIPSITRVWDILGYFWMTLWPSFFSFKSQSFRLSLVGGVRHKMLLLTHNEESTWRWEEVVRDGGRMQPLQSFRGPWVSAKALEMLNENCLPVSELPPCFPNAVSAVTTNYFVCCISDRHCLSPHIITTEIMLVWCSSPVSFLIIKPRLLNESFHITDFPPMVLFRVTCTSP